MTTEPPLDSVRAVRLLRAKAAELESTIMQTHQSPNEMTYLAADIALIASLLADAIERWER